MPSLKDYRDRIASVKSTRKITSAMKMVAASKLKRAQDQAEKSQPYAEHMNGMITRLAANIQITDQSPFLIRGTGDNKRHLLIVVTSDRGLCGGFNAYIIRQAQQKIRDLVADDKDVKIICVGRKGRDALRRTYADKIIGDFVDTGKGKLSFADAHAVAEIVLDLAATEEFDVCTVIYNQFKSVISQVPTEQQLVPFALPHANDDVDQGGDDTPKAQYIFEPDEETILEELLPRNLAVQIFRTMLDSAAGEQAARMTAMDNATRNAGEMIDGLNITYNRARQAYITTELIEIIAGAEAL